MALLLPLLAALSLVAPAAAVEVALKGAIYGVSTPYVGMMGQARITIFGQGFMREGVDGQTVAYLGAYRCNTIEYYSSDTQIVCDTPAFATQVRRRRRRLFVCLFGFFCAFADHFFLHFFFRIVGRTICQWPSRSFHTWAHLSPTATAAAPPCTLLLVFLK
jgi:hypothetical protein